MKKLIYSITLSLLLIGSAVATRPGLSSSPAIHIQPETALADEVVSIRLSGLKPNQAATIKATMPSSHGHLWKSHAEFIADKNGSVDLSKQASARGTYTGVDAMGLFWSMERVEAEGQQAAASGSLSDPLVMKFELEVEGKIVASANLIRLSIKPDVKAVDVRDDGLVAKLYYPGAGGPHPGIIVIGGSEGGIQSAERGAALFASHGYAALAVAYFGIEDLPKRLVEVPIDYMKKAIDWMGKREGVDASRLAIMGGSKGGELALLLASRYSEIKAVVAYVPSHVVWQGIGGGGSSWSYDGKPLPYVPYKPGVTPTTRGTSKQMVIAPLYLASLDDKEAVEKATIPVENINGPVLLISGKSDDLWPSSLMGEMVIARLKKYNHKHKYEHLSYESAGHSIGTTYRPTTASMGTGTLALGGTPVANARAQADSWPKVLKFLSESTRKNSRPPAPITSETIKSLESLIPELMNEAQVPGLSIALIKNADVFWHRGFGMKNATTKEPVDENTVFEAASLTKPVFAYGVLKLAESGKLDLDAPLSGYLPELYIKDDERIKQVTARMVLSHNPGFPNWRPREKPLVIHFNPGERFSYSGEGYVYLAKVVEHITGESLNDFMKKTVFDPLGMASSSLVWQERYDALSATGHNGMGAPVKKNKPSEANAAASLHTTALDYAKFVVAIMRGTGLKKETLKQMLGSQIKLDEECVNCTGRTPARLSSTLSWGLGWGLQNTEDGESFWHWGDNGPFKCYIVAYSKQQTGVVIFTNTVSGLSIHHEIINRSIGGSHPAIAWLKYDTYNSPAKQFQKTILRDGIEIALKHYRAAMDKKSQKDLLNENQMNQLGYDLLGAKKIREAIEVFKLNVEAYPQSSNVYDSLGEAYMANGDKEPAISNYEKSLELNPQNTNAVEMLKKLREKQ